MKVKRRPQKPPEPPKEKSWWCKRGMPQTCLHMAPVPCSEHPNKENADE